MKKITLAIITFLVCIYSNVYSANSYLFTVDGSIYLQNIHTPLKGIEVTLIANGKEVGKGITNPEGYYVIKSSVRSEQLQFCIHSTKESIPGIGVCENINAFTKPGFTTSGVEIRTLTHNFFTDNKGNNLNKDYADKISQEPEEHTDEYELAKLENAEQVKINDAKKAEEAYFAKIKESSHMPIGSPLSHPYANISVAGVLKTTGLNIDPRKILIQVFSHDGVLLKELGISDNFDYQFRVTPKTGAYFLSPIIIKITSTETQLFQDKNVQKYKPIYLELANESNVLVSDIEPYIPGDKDIIVTDRAGLPIIIIASIIFIFISLSIWYTKRAENLKINDY